MKVSSPSLPFGRSRSVKTVKKGNARVNEDIPGTRTTPIVVQDDDSPDPLIRTSFSDLKRPDARQLLRRQFSGTFPEASGEATDETSPNMTPVDPWKGSPSDSSPSLGVSTNTMAKSSTSSVNSAVDLKRLSVVPEKLDIEQAINLLQELKKTASPEDLVALHRALLPTRSMTPAANNRDSVAEEKPSPSEPRMRRSSAIPPGLATRGGSTDDLLKKQSDITARAKAEKAARKKLAHHSVSKSGDGMDALDLAAKGNPNPVIARSTTPSDLDVSHTGAFRPGTLRVMNGRASPELSSANLIKNKIKAAQNEKIATANAKKELTEASVAGGLSLAAQQRQEHSRRVQGLLRARQQPTSRGRPSFSSETPSFDQARPSVPLRVVTDVREASVRSPVLTIQSADLPAVSKPWVQHAASLSQEYLTDCGIATSPYEQKGGLLHFARELNTGDDSDVDEAGEQVVYVDARTVAMARLSGKQEPVEVASIVASPTTRDSEETATSSEGSSNVRQPAARKPDSGYSSDVSQRVMQRKMNEEAGRPSLTMRRVNERQVLDDPGRPSISMRRKVSEEAGRPSLSMRRVSEQRYERSVSEKKEDTASLFTFDEILESAPPSEDTPSRPSMSSKRPSPLSLFKPKSKRGSNMSESPSQSTDTLMTMASIQSSPADLSERSVKQKGRLHKPMPAALRKQRKAELQKMKEDKMASWTTAVRATSPAISDLPPRPHTSAGMSSHPIIVEESPDDLASFSGTLTSPQAQTGAEENPLDSAETVKGSRKRFGRRRSHTITAPKTAEMTPASSELDLSRPQSNTQRRDEDSNGFGNERRAPDAVNDGILRRADIQLVSKHAATIPSMTPDRLKHQTQLAFRDRPVQSKKSIKGMDEKMASELARKKSRDFSMESRPDRPRVATPTSKFQVAAHGDVSSPSDRSVEDFFPEWHGKPASRDTSRERSAQASSPMERVGGSPYAESIPPLPELSAAMQAKVMAAEEKKKRKGSARSSPLTSARSSVNVDDAMANKFTQAKKAIQLRREQEARDAGEMEWLGTRATANPDVATSRSQDDSRPSRWSRDGSIQLPLAEDATQVASPTHDTEYPGWPGWQDQAKKWRERRNSLGAMLGKPVVDEEGKDLADADSPPSHQQQRAAETPAIVYSRYITPTAADHAVRARAAEGPMATTGRANAYSHLVTRPGSALEENRPPEPDVPRIDSAFSTTSSSISVSSSTSTDGRPTLVNIAHRSGSALSSYTTTTTVSNQMHTSSSHVQQYQETSTPTGGNTKRYGTAVRHVRTPSGNYVPYRPSDAAAAERSRERSLAQLTGGSPYTIQEGSQESLALPAGPRPLPEDKRRSAEGLVGDRYSGGLGYGWDRARGFGGSAGMRSRTPEGDEDGARAGERRSQVMSETGVDFGDVPVFLRRV